jgi:hypothetical protein
MGKLVTRGCESISWCHSACCVQNAQLSQDRNRLDGTAAQTAAATQANQGRAAPWTWVPHLNCRSGKARRCNVTVVGGQPSSLVRGLSRACAAYCVMVLLQATPSQS